MKEGCRYQFNLVSDTDIAIIGMAARFPESPDIDQYWLNLRDGKDCISRKKRLNIIQEPQWGGFIEDIEYFDSDFFNISNKEAKQIDPRQRIFMEVVWHALENSGYAGAKIYGSSTGVFVGITNNQYGSLFSNSCVHQTNALYNSNASVANRVSHFMNFRGPSMSIDSTCSSSALAIYQACQSLHSGECTMAIAGGVQLLLSNELFISFSKMNLLSPRGKTCAFSRKAEGFVLGEGAGAVILKPLKQAVNDNDYIYGIIKGGSVNYSGRTKHLMGVNPYSYIEVIKNIFKKFKIDPSSIQYLEANGTASIIGDALEIWAILRAFDNQGKKQQKRCAIGTVKNNIGNLDPASGIAALIKIVLSLKNKEIPPIINLDKLNRFIKTEDTSFFFNESLTKFEKSGFPLRAAINSFGVGGTNVFIVVEEAPPMIKKELEGENPQSPYRIITFSAQNKKSLKEGILAAKDYILKDKELNLSEICYTFNTGRGHFKNRLAFIFNSKTELLNILDEYGSKGQSKDTLREGIFSTPPVSEEGYSRKTEERSLLKIFLKNYAYSSGKIDVGHENKYIASFYPYESANPNILFIFSDLDSVSLNFDASLEYLKENGLIFHAMFHEIEKLSKEKKLTSEIKSLLMQYGLGYMFLSWKIKPSKILCEGKGLFAAACITRMTKLENLLKILTDLKKKEFPPIPFTTPLLKIYYKESSVLKKDDPLIEKFISTQGLDCVEKIETLVDPSKDNIFIIFGGENALGESLKNNSESNLIIINLFENKRDLFQNVLSAIAKMYVCGTEIDWELIEKMYNGRKIPITNYHFFKKYCWLNES